MNVTSKIYLKLSSMVIRKDGSVKKFSPPDCK